MSLCTQLSGVVARDLDSIRAAIAAYPDEALLWQPVPGLANTAGNLALHLTGNLRHFIGAVLGGTGFVRDRDAEFARRGVPQAELLAALDATRDEVDRTLAALDDAALARDFPQPVAGLRITTGEFLVHLVSHLGYHIGQIDTHRRIVTGDSRPAGAQSIPGLRTARKA